VQIRDDEPRRDRVLVVDDTSDTLAMLTDALEGAGMTVLVSLDGISALERAQHGKPDIILLDAIMPGLDGFETCARLKQLPTVASVPVVFMTGLSDTEHVIRGFGAGGVDYVTKPIVPEQLIARLRTHLANARMVNSARDALDLAGRAAFALDVHGRIGWRTPSAASMLSLLHAGDAQQLDPALAALLMNDLGTDDAVRARRAVTIDTSAVGISLSFTRIGRTHGDQLLVAVERSDAAGDAERLGSQYGLTPREAEVLIWIARGKSNRDIGEILALSPRTVNKHLEHIYVKLGVENRASAAALATAVLSERAQGG